MQAKQLGHPDLSTVAQIVGPGDLGPQIKNEVVCHCDETTCFDTYAVAYLPRVHAVCLQGITNTWHP